jgi:drug/metabolite transporter (DMT)-like permease
VSAVALALVLSAAVILATWNYLLKRSGGGTPVIWLFALASALIYAPVAAAVVWWTQPTLSAMSFVLIAASAIIHTAYYMLLDRGYRTGDLSLVYPLARGSAPLITVGVAVFLLHENPSSVALGGAFLVAGGAVVLTGNSRSLKESRSLPAVAFALMTGCMIASYTVVDKLAVATFFVPPLVQDWATNMGRVAILTPLALRQRSELRAVWHRSWRQVIAVAILCPLSYILVLTAMVFTPVSYVAPAREISILVGTLLGAHLLAEEHAMRRLAGAGAMVAGIVCLAVG